jgi:8-oxo-dGTP pyrophosphatase MutT (NUDIX family)
MKKDTDYKINYSALQPKDKPTIPEPAATVLLTRDYEQKIEVLMLKRAAKTNFGGAWVFPGGKLDNHDNNLDFASLCHSLNDADASKKLNIKQGGINYWVACIRECFEECGILLAYRDNGQRLNKTFEHENIIMNKYRKKLINDEPVFLEMLKKLNMKLATDQLAYISHWVTPTIETRRYSTRFFVAKSPQQLANHDGHEGVDSKWINPQQALDDESKGKFPIIMPTIKNLEFIANYQSTNALLKDSKKRKGSEIPKIEPKFILEKGKPKLVSIL